MEKIANEGEVAIDVNGECLWEIVRIRISVDVTKQLKNILFFKENGEKNPDVSAIRTVTILLFLLQLHWISI